VYIVSADQASAADSGEVIPRLRPGA